MVIAKVEITGGLDAVSLRGIPYFRCNLAVGRGMGSVESREIHGQETHGSKNASSGEDIFPEHGFQREGAGIDSLWKHCSFEMLIDSRSTAGGGVIDGGLFRRVNNIQIRADYIGTYEYLCTKKGLRAFLVLKGPMRFDASYPPWNTAQLHWK